MNTQVIGVTLWPDMWQPKTGEELWGLESVHPNMQRHTAQQQKERKIQWEEKAEIFSTVGVEWNSILIIILTLRSHWMKSMLQSLLDICPKMWWWRLYIDYTLKLDAPAAPITLSVNADLCYWHFSLESVFYNPRCFPSWLWSIKGSDGSTQKSFK